MSTNSDPDGLDAEVLELVGADDELRRAAIEVRALLHATTVDADFRRRLGAEVVARRRQLVEERSRPRWLPAGFRPAGRPLVALAGAAVALALVLSAILVTRPTPVTVVATSPAAGLASFDPSARIVLRFSRPMDHDAVVAAFRVTPATAVRTAWSGEDLVVTPLHGLAPNSPYVLTIDGSRARTASGASLAGDLHVVFGTAPLPGPAHARPAAVALPLRTVAGAAEGSEAVIVNGGLVVTTSASKFGASGIMRLHTSGAAEWLAPATDAICVSRSGSSLAYLERDTSGTSIVIASSDGTAPRTLTVSVDDGSPLGWIGDAEVSFVGGGQLRAVDRTGQVRVLASQQVDAAKDTVAISPGGRYAFVRSGSALAAPGQGRLIDLTTGAGHELPGVVDEPAFSADGATVAWFDGSGPLPRLALAPSAGGPVLRLPLPVAAGDHLSDLGLAPAGGRFVYAVQHEDGLSELRLAAIGDGATLAISTHAGASPNWAPDGQSLAVLTHTGPVPEIAVAEVPGATVSPADAAYALVSAFARAQIGGDQDAMRALAAGAVDVGRLPAASRASIVSVSERPDGPFVAVLRLVVDPTPGRPSARALSEALELRVNATGTALQVTSAAAGPLADVQPGPHLTRIAANASAGTVALTFDADLDLASIRNAFAVSVRGGSRPVSAAYDASTRTVTLSAPTPLTGTLAVTVGTGLQDVAGQHPRSTLHEDVTA